MYANPGIPHENIPPHWHYIRYIKFLYLQLLVTFINFYIAVSVYLIYMGMEEYMISLAVMEIQGLVLN